MAVPMFPWVQASISSFWERRRRNQIPDNDTVVVILLVLFFWMCYAESYTEGDESVVFFSVKSYDCSYI